MRMHDKKCKEEARSLFDEEEELHHIYVEAISSNDGEYPLPCDMAAKIFAQS
jgi:hypothetical protein